VSLQNVIKYLRRNYLQFFYFLPFWILFQGLIIQVAFVGKFLMSIFFKHYMIHYDILTDGHDDKQFLCFLVPYFLDSIFFSFETDRIPE
jgi:hypothetical protein